MSTTETEPVIIKTQKRVKTPTVIQMEAVECGAAALAIVLEHYGRIVPLEELRVACGVSRDGSKASNVLKAGRRFGLESKGYRADLDDLIKYPTPMIVHWNFNHFLVLEGATKKKVYLNDPSNGPRTVTHEEFDMGFTGVVLTFSPGPDFKAGGGKRSSLIALRKRLRGLSLPLLYVFLAGLFLVIPGLAAPIFTKVFVDNILIRRMESWMAPLLLGMGLAVFVKFTLTWLQQYYLLRLRTKLSISESGKYFLHLLRLPVEFFSQRYAGDLGKRVAVNDRLAHLLTGKLANAFLDMIVIIFYAALMFYYDVMLTLIGILIASLNLIILKAVSRIREDSNRNLMVQNGQLYGTGMSGLKLIETLKATGSESDFFSKWTGNHAKVLDSTQKLGRISYLLMITPPFISSLVTVAILVFGGVRVMDGAMSMGMLVAFQSLMGSFIEPFNNLVNLGADLQKTKGDMNLLDDVLRYEEDPYCVEKTAAEPNQGKLSGYLEIKDLTFGYNPLDKPLIEGFSLKLKPGDRVALVGKSGSGKSTVAKVVSGLFKAWDGQILFDGKPRMEIPKETFINSVSSIDQNILMFEGTVRDNLTMWNKTIPDMDIIQAAKDAAIHDDITSREGGYQSRVQEGGANFSGGQRQRLEIARGLVNNPTLLVMDEATSALDAKTEKLIDNQLRARGCTCLIIAHRLSTIRDCDEIIVLSKGKVVQRGTHDSMAAEEGPYADLIKSI